MNRERKERAQSRRQRSAPAAASGVFQRLDLGRKNWILFGSGLGAIVLGFVLLSQGDITLAPILLVVGYIVLIPWALVARSRAERPTRPADSRGSGGE
jgi:hypothetical protein